MSEDVEAYADRLNDAVVNLQLREEDRDERIEKLERRVNDLEASLHTAIGSQDFKHISTDMARTATELYEKKWSKS